MVKPRKALFVAVAILALTACGQSADPIGPIPTVPISDEGAELPQFDPPTFDRIRPSDFGPDYILGELILIIDDRAADPLEAASSIAAEFDGQVTAGDSDLRIYQLRFGDEELDELRRLRDQIAELQNVKAVGLHPVSQFDPDS